MRAAKPMMELTVEPGRSRCSRSPVMGGATGRPPVALTTRSGCSARTLSGSPDCPVLMSTPARRARSTDSSRYFAMRHFAGSRAAWRTLPPGCSPRSSSVTAQPTSAALEAASSPAGPPPTTTTLVGTLTFVAR